VVADGVFPPPGYVEIEARGRDGYGEYLPLGLEDARPVLCAKLRRERRLVPVASSTDAWPLVRGIDVDSQLELLTADPCSPRGLVLAAAKQRWGKAERGLRRALTVLPEYAEALYGLVRLLRRQRRRREALELMLEAGTAPLAFGSRELREQCFRWLRAAPDLALPDCRDPLWLRRRELTLAEAVRWNDDYLVYEDAIAAYHELGWGVRAVRLRVLVGELMGLETVSFRERYGWTFEGHAEKLAADLARAGLPPR
jgi:hypothetical protein